MTVPHLIIDGPKGWSATALALAAGADQGVALAAIHNFLPEKASTQTLTSLLGQDVFYEHHFRELGGAWKALRNQEIFTLEKLGAARSLEQSSLGVFDVRSSSKRRLATCLKPQFLMFQPALLRLFWRFGLFRAARQLHSGSFRVVYSRVFRFLRPEKLL